MHTQESIGISESTEKETRLAQWHQTLTQLPSDENSVAWYRELQHALSDMLDDGLIEPGEAYDLRAQADGAFSQYADNPIAGSGAQE